MVDELEEVGRDVPKVGDVGLEVVHKSHEPLDVLARNGFGPVGDCYLLWVPTHKALSLHRIGLHRQVDSFADTCLICW